MGVIDGWVGAKRAVEDEFGISHSVNILSSPQLGKALELTEFIRTW